MIRIFRLWLREFLGKEVSEWALRIERDDKRINRFLRRKLAKKSTCIDIGAHDGSFLDFYLNLAPEGNHVAFEPLSTHYQKLKEAYPSVTIHNMALSDYSGTSIFYEVEGAEAMSGFQKQDYPVDVDVKKIEVSVDCLDNICLDEEKIDFIKIDVEGAELRVLRGSTSIIKKFKPPIMFEFAKIHVEEYKVTPAEVHDFFRELGYEIFRLDLRLSYTIDEFCKVFEVSHESYYDRNAETNFLALPRSL